MTPELFETLLKRSELRTLDFKSTQYAFDGATEDERNRKRGHFVKDIVSMANTPRDTSAYIVIGVRRESNGTCYADGVLTHPDDSALQQKLESLVHPIPVFHYEQFEYSGKQFGIIEIADSRPTGPFFTTRDVRGAGIERSRLYWRRGSKNSEANPEDQKAIHAWFAGVRSSSSQFPQIHTDAWTRLQSRAVFEDSETHFMLVLLPDSNLQRGDYSKIGFAPWGIVLDFDPRSDFDGTLYLCRSRMLRSRSLHLVAPTDELQGNASSACFWYFARGHSGHDSPCPSTYKDWNRFYGDKLRKKLARYASITQNPVVAIAILTDSEQIPYLRNVFDAIAAQFAARARLIIVETTESGVSQLADEVGAESYPLSETDFFSGLEAMYSHIDHEERPAIQIPGRGGAPRVLDQRDLLWIGEDLELIHSQVGLSHPSSGLIGENYYRGGNISWFELGIGVDVERDRTAAVMNAVRADLISGTISRINILHRPGAGGTTVARRVAWSLRREFPTVMLRRCIARETVERIAFLYSKSEQSILIVREGSMIPDAEAEDLYQHLSARHVPSVLLQVLRRHEVEPERERRFFLSGALSDEESERFRVKFLSASPQGKNEIEAVARANSEQRNPFLFGLAAFSNSFAGLRPFVENHLADLGDPSRTVLKILAIAQVYGQQSIHDQHFSELLALPPERRVKLRSALPPAALGLMMEVESGKWRLLHDLVAREVLVRVLGHGLPDERNWRTRLADCCCEFIDFCTPQVPEMPEDLLTLLERVFFYRDDSRLIGSVRAGDKAFAEVIREIPTPEGGLTDLSLTA